MRTPLPLQFLRNILQFHVIILILEVILANASLQQNETDKLTLLSFKASVSRDPFGVTNSWNDSVHFCSWEGVSCSRRRRRRGRVIRLDFHGKKLDGSLTPQIGNLSFLRYLHLGSNCFRGEIPREVSRLSMLRFLDLSANAFQGEIPRNFSSSLQSLSLAYNQLHGEIPPDIGLTLPNLRQLTVAANGFHGGIPASLPNASQLEMLDFGVNEFTGHVPLKLGGLKGLKYLALDGNQLQNPEEGFSFLASLSNCTSLKILQLDANKFMGELPVSIANFSVNLRRFTLQMCQVSGKIPQGIGKLIGLSVLALAGNAIVGEIPSTIGKLERLTYLYLGGNKISGTIPSSIGNLTRLLEMSFEENNIEGEIPSSFGNLGQLQQLYLHWNRLGGNIPREVSRYSRALLLNLSQNSMTWPFPPEVSNLSNLVQLDISYNRLVGGIPTSLSKCLMLERISLQNNLLGGTIPSSLVALKALRVLDLSRNNFSGQIPKGFQSFKLMMNLNLSFNNLEGEVPNEGIFRNASVVSLIGNKKLCWGHKQTKPLLLVHLKVVIPIILSCVFILVAFFVRFSKIRKSRGKAFATARSHEMFPKISYQELSKATHEFSSSNLIGEGSFGSVYKGTLNKDGPMPVAVKVLKHIGAAKSFMSECEALRNIRHRNIIKIVTVCSSIDIKGNDFKALVYEFMQNGSLDVWLHPNDDALGQLKKQNLTLIQRLNIAIDVASAIEYLHCHCQPLVIHGDLKPSNVLLNHEMVAHVADFGLARFQPKALPCTSSSSQTMSWISSGLQGTVGYVAPEYGIGSKASVKGDVYSFGILLLEMITGKRPTDEMFKDGLTLHQFIEVVLLERSIADVIEPCLFQETRVGRRNERRVAVLESLMEVGLLCSMEYPNDRPEMKYVTAELCAIRDFLHNTI